MQKESSISKTHFLRSFPNLLTLALVIIATGILVGVGSIALLDITYWNKDIATIFLGPRTGEPITLGLGMILIHYLLIGITLLGAGMGLLFRNRILTPSPQQPILIQSQKNIKKTAKFEHKTQKNLVNHHKKQKDSVPKEEKFASGCIHYFGYLSSRPKYSPVPQKCLICSRLGSCMVATVYLKKI